MNILLLAVFGVGSIVVSVLLWRVMSHLESLETKVDGLVTAVNRITVGAQVEAAMVKADLAEADRKVAGVATDLAEARGRADNVKKGEAGEAADAASQNPRHV